MNNKQLQAQVKQLQRQLSIATKLLEHQDKHLLFLEGLLGKQAVKQEDINENPNEELQEEIQQLLKEQNENT